MAYDGALKFDTSIDAKGFQKGVDSIAGIAGKGLKATGAILTGAATAIGGMGIAAVKAGMDFEAAMSKVGAISGAAGNDLEALTEKAKEMGESTIFSATESAEAFQYMAMAGWKTEDMLNGIEGIMNLAAASGEELATTSDIVTDALTAFGLSAADSTHFADVLAQASSNANTNVGMMGETFKYVAPVAGSLGYTAEDTATAIGLMANSGIKASQAGTSLRSIMSRLAKPTDEVQAAMDALGISLTDDQGNMKSLNEVMHDLREGFSGLSAAEKANRAASLGGQEAMSGLLAIVNASEADFNKLQDSIYNCDGAAAKMAETMNDNLHGQLTLLKSGLEGLGIAFYEQVENPLKEVAEEAKNMVEQLSDALESGGLDGFVAEVGVLAQAAEKVAAAAPDMINAAAGLVSSFCNSLKSSTGIGEAAAGMITSLVTALFGCAGNLWTTAIVLAGKLAQGIADGTPEMVLAVTSCVTDIFGCLADWAPDFVTAGVQVINSISNGMAGMLPALLQNGIDIVLELGRGISETIPTLVPIAVECILGLLDTFVDNIDSIIDVGIDIIMAIADGIIQALPTLIQKAPDIIINFWKAIDRNLVKLLGAGADLVMKLIQGIISAIPDLIANIPKILEAIILTIQHFNFLQAGKSIILAIGNGIKTAGGTLLSAVAEIDWGSVAAGMVKMASSALEVVNTYLAEAVLWLVDTAREFMSGLPGKIWEAVTEAIPKIMEWGAQMMDAVSEAAWNCVDAAATWFSELPERIWNWLALIVTNVTAWGAELLTAAWEAAGSAITGIVNFFAALPEKIMYWLGFAIGTVVNWGIELFNWVITELPVIIESIITFFATLPDRIWDWLAETVTKIVEWGSNLKNTAETWVINTIDSVIVWFSELPWRIWTWLADTVNKIIQWGLNLASTAGTAASNTINMVLSWFMQLPDKVWTWLSNTIAKITEFGHDMKDKAKEAAKGFVDKLTDGVKGLPDKMLSIGSDIVKGIWKGISSGWKWLTDEVKNLADSLVKGVKDALGINSPSKRFADEIGRWIPPGIEEGASDAMPDLEAQMDSEMDGLIRKMQNAVEVETGNIMVKSKAKAQHHADIECPAGGDTYVDNHIEQENNYHTPVASPSEVSRAQREAARKLLGGVK